MFLRPDGDCWRRGAGSRDGEFDRNGQLLAGDAILPFGFAQGRLASLLRMASFERPGTQRISGYVYRQCSVAGLDCVIGGDHRYEFLSALGINQGRDTIPGLENCISVRDDQPTTAPNADDDAIVG
jgi:hypothetical protein